MTMELPNPEAFEFALEKGLVDFEEIALPILRRYGISKDAAFVAYAILVTTGRLGEFLDDLTAQEIAEDWETE